MEDRSGTGRLSYQPALDGLRAIAVLAVLLYHDEALELLRGGFLGVDIFFVLSGFLITNILLADDAERGSTISADFWYRRLRRLLPAFLLLMVLVAIDAALQPDTWRNQSIRTQGIAALVYVANWHAIYRSDFTQTLFSHTWSLSVEEEWYVIWPFLLATLLFLTRRRRTLLILAAMILIAISATLMAHFMATTSAIRAFFGTDTRAWELIAGALLAFVFWKCPPLSPRTQRVLDLAGIAGIAYMAWAFSCIHDVDLNLYPGQRLVLVGAAMLVIAAGIQPKSRVVRPILSWPPLVLVGLVSYGVYLFHIPIYSWVSPRNLGFSGVPMFILRLVAVIGFATASYRLLELPVRRGALRRLGVNGFVAVPVAVGLVLAAFVFATPPNNLTSQEILTILHYRQLAKTTPRETRRVLVVGDTTAFQLGWHIKAPIDIGGIRGATAATMGCGIAAGSILIGDTALPPARCRPWGEVYRQAIDAFDPAITVLLVGNLEVFDRLVEGRVLRVGSPELERHLDGQLEAARRILTAGHRRLVLATIPCVGPGPPTLPEFESIRRDPNRVAWVNGVWRRFATAHPDSVSLANLDEVLCPDGNPRSVIGTAFRPDGISLSPTGAKAVWEWLAPIAIQLPPGR